MTMTPHRCPTALAAAAALAAAWLAVAPANAAGAAADNHAAIEARYQTERKACLDGRTGQDQATCLKEAGAARAEALRQRLEGGETRETLAANALRRCAAQPPGDRAACELLARGQGMEQGSVRDGGVIKEVVSRTVGKPSTPPIQPQRSASAPAIAQQPTR